jgi:hypothetical protein
MNFLQVVNVLVIITFYLVQLRWAFVMRATRVVCPPRIDFKGYKSFEVQRTFTPLPILPIWVNPYSIAIEWGLGVYRKWSFRHNQTLQVPKNKTKGHNGQTTSVPSSARALLKILPGPIPRPEWLGCWPAAQIIVETNLMVSKTQNWVHNLLHL